MKKTFNEQKLLIAQKLSNLISISPKGTKIYNFYTNLVRPSNEILFNWRDSGKGVEWDKEGLKVCHEAEKLLSGGFEENDEWLLYIKLLHKYTNGRGESADFEIRLKSLCEIWCVEKY